MDNGKRKMDNLKTTRNFRLIVIVIFHFKLLSIIHYPLITLFQTANLRYYLIQIISR